MDNNNNQKEFTYEIKEYIGVIANQQTGWKKELNLVSWNGTAAKYDIRDWDPEHEHMSKGITLHADEMKKLLELMQNRNL